MDISFRTIRIGPNSFDVPLFMDKAQFDAISEIIENFENSIGLKEDEFDSNFIFEIFSDIKIAKGVYFILTKYFYDIKGLESSDLNAFQLRLNLFELMEKSGLSWVSSRQQKQLLSTLSVMKNMTATELESMLFSDFSENFKVIRKSQEKPEVNLVLEYYNTEILRFLISKSYAIKFELINYQEKGFFVKTLIKACKLLGLDYELEPSNDLLEKKLKITLLGPYELVGRNIRYASNLYSFFIRNLELLSKEVDVASLEVQYFELVKHILLPLKDFPKFVDDSTEEIVYDSAIEKIFFDQWTINFPHWTITREPLIIEQNLVMIPDFLLSYRNIIFYLEIVGFWTERYLTKKIKKVSLLKNKYPNMILLVDRSLDWPSTEIPSFFYDKKVPVLEIGLFLNQFEEQGLYSVYQTMDFLNIKTNIIAKFKTQHILLEKDLFNLFQVVYSFELKKVIEKYFEYFKNEVNFVFFSNHNFLCSLEFLFEMNKTLNVAFINKKLDYSKLKNQFDFLGERTLKIILTYLGYDFKYKSLLEEELYFKKKKVVVPEII